MAIPATSPKPVVYHMGGGRKTVLSLAFLILLPFFVSLPIMLGERLSAGLWVGTIGLMVFGLAFAFLMGLIFTQLLHSLRSRVELGDTSVKMTLPRGRGIAPVRFIKREIPYTQIKAVETRKELYGGSLAPNLLGSSRIVTKDGESIRLGYAHEEDTDPPLPVQEIAADIAQRAGLAVSDMGAVHRSVSRRIMGIAATAEENAPLTAEQIASCNARHSKAMKALVAALVLLLGAGIASDFFWASGTTFAVAGGAQTREGQGKVK